LNCPVPCLTMAPGYQKPSRQISRDTLEKPAPSAEELAAKEAAKKAKIEAAMKAKAAREAAK
ncbi:MAG: 4Fe-4S ferredoxin, partial [Eggerthellaceae bacterium]|nr:4Fe-4S ferredoxin [Eggerthellaceae bacterium]